MPETLKALSDVCAPDPRNVGWKILNRDTGLVRDLTFAEHHGAVESLALSTSVPDQLDSLYNTARNVLLYSWYVYRFITVAELQAYAALEFALRWRFDVDQDEKPPALSALLRRAAVEGLLQDEDLRPLRDERVPPVYTGNPFLDANIDRSEVERIGHVKLLCSALPRLRNELAHGSASVWPSAMATFLVVKTCIEGIVRHHVAAT